MANMSYCAAENTNNDVLDLIDLIRDGEKDDVFDEYEGSDYEADAIRSLAENAKELAWLCNNLIERYGD